MFVFLFLNYTLHKITKIVRKISSLTFGCGVHSVDLRGLNGGISAIRGILRFLWGLSLYESRESRRSSVDFLRNGGISEICIGFDICIIPADDDGLNLWFCGVNYS